MIQNASPGFVLKWKSRNWGFLPTLCILFGLGFVLCTANVFPQEAPPVPSQPAVPEVPAPETVETAPESPAPPNPGDAGESLDPPETQPTARLDPSKGYGQLLWPTIADRIGLTEAQKLEVLHLMNARRDALAAVPLNDTASQEKIVAESDAKLSALLTPEQQKLWPRIFEQRILRPIANHQPWDSFLRWFAGQVGKQLDMNDPPKGTITFTSPDELSPTEVLDQINSRLYLQGYTLLNNEQTLIVFNLKRGEIPLEFLPKVDEITIQDRGRFEFVAFTLPLEYRNREVVMQTIKPYQGMYGKERLLTGNSILLIDNVANIKNLISLARGVHNPIPEKPKPEPPPPAPPQSVWKEYKIEKNDPDAVETIINDFVNVKGFRRQGGNILYYFVPEDKHTSIRTIVDMLEKSEEDRPKPVLETYSMEGLIDTSPEILYRKAFMQVYRQAVDTDANFGTAVVELIKKIAPDAAVAPNRISNRLVVFATPGDHEKIRDLFTKLQSAPSPELTPLAKIYRSKNPEQLLSIDPQLLDTFQKTVPTAQFSFDRNKGELLVVGIAKDQEVISRLLGEIEEQTLPEDDKYLVLYPVTSGQIRRFNLLFNQIRRQTPLLRDAIELQDGRNNQLSIFGTAAQHRKIREILSEIANQGRGTLDSASPDIGTVPGEGGSESTGDSPGNAPQSGLLTSDSPNLKMDTIVLRNAYAYSVQQVLLNMIPGIEVSIDHRTNSLIVYGSPQDLANVRGAVEQMDAGLDQVVLFFPLREEPSQDVRNTFPVVAPRARTVFDKKNMRLMVFGPQRDVLEIKKIVDSLEVHQSDSKESFNMFDTGRNLPEELLDFVRKTFPKAEIQFNRDSKRVVIIAPENELVDISKLILEVESTLPAEEITAFYPLEDPITDHFLTLIRESVRNMGQIGEIKRDDKNPKLLIVRARPEIQEKIAQVIRDREIFLPSIEPNRLRSFPITPDTRRRFDAVRDDFIRQNGDFRILNEDRKDILSVWASPSQIRQLEELIEQLGKEMSPEISEKQIFHALKYTDLETVRPLLTEIYPGTIINEDQLGGRIIVRVRPEFYEGAKELLEKLDSRDPDQQRRYPKAYEVDGLYTTDARGNYYSPYTFLQDIEKYVPQAKVRFDRFTQQLILWGTEEEHRIVEETLNAVKKDDDKTSGFEKYPLRRAQPHIIIGMINRLYPLLPTRYDAGTRSLIVEGGAHQLKAIEKLIDKLDPVEPGPSDPVIRFYKLRSKPDASLVSSLRQVVPGVSITPDEDAKQLMVIAKPDEHTTLEHNIKSIVETFTQPEEPMLFTYQVSGEQRKRLESFIAVAKAELKALRTLEDSTPGLISIWARPKEHELISDVLLQIQSNENGELGLRLKGFPLSVLNPSTARDVVQQLHPEVKLIPDSQTNRLLVYATEPNLQKVADTLREIDANVVDQTQPRFDVFTVEGIRFEEDYVRRGSLYQIISSLRPIAPSARYFPGSDYYRIIVWGTPLELDRIRSAMEIIGYSSSPEDRPSAKVIQLKAVDSGIIESILKPTVPDATITLDETSGNIVVFARPKDMETVDSIIESLERSSTDARIPFTYTITGTKSEIVLQSIRDVYPSLKITEDTRTNRLSIWATAEEHARIGDLVEQINEEPEGEMVEKFKAYPITRAYYGTVLAMIKAMYPEAVAYADQLSEKITIKARVREHKEIKELLESFQSKDNDFRPKFSVYPFGKADPVVVESTLQSLLPQGRSLTAQEIRNQVRGFGRGNQGYGAMSGEFDQIDLINMQRNPQAFFIPREGRTYYRVDPNTKSAIVIATAEDQQRIAEAIDAIVSVSETSANAKARFFSLVNVPVIQILPMLQRIAPSVQILRSDNPLDFVAYGIEPELEKIVQIVEEINDSGTSGNRREMLLITMPAGTKQSRDRILRMLASLYPPINRASIPVAGPEPNQIIFWNFKNLHEQIQSVVDEVCKPLPEDQQTFYRKYPVEHIKMVDAIRWLEQICPNAVYEEETPKIDMYSHTPLNNKVLIVLASPVEHKEIEKALSDLDVESSEQERFFTRVYTIHELGAHVYYGAIRQVAPSAQITFGWDYHDFIAYANLTEHEKIRNFVEEINDQGPSESRREFNIVLVPPGTRYSRQLLVQLIAAYFPQLYPQPGLEANQISVYGTLYQKNQAQELVEKACAAVPEEEQTAPRWYQLKYITDYNAIRWLKQVCPNAVFELDARVDGRAGLGFIAIASPPEHLMIEKTLEELDEDVPEELRPYPVLYDVADFSPGSYWEIYYAMRGNFYDMISCVPISDRLAFQITAKKETHERITEFLKGVEEDRESRKPSFQVYTLKYANFNNVVPILVRLCTSPATQITQGPRADIVHVFGIPRDQRAIEEAIRKIELSALLRAEQDEQGTAASIKVYRVASKSALSLYPTLLREFPGAIIHYPTLPDEIIVWASPTDHQRLEKMMDAFAEAYPEQYLKPYFCKHVRPDEMLGMIRQLFTYTQAIITYRYSTGDIIVQASQEYHEKIAKSIEELDIPRPKEFERYAFAYDLSDFNIPYIQYNIVHPITVAIPGCVLLPHVDQAQLVVYARASEHEKVEQMIGEMKKKNPALALRMKSYTIKTATARDVYSLLLGVAPNARIGLGTDRHQLMIHASLSDHEKIRGAIEEFDRVDPHRTVPDVYRFQRTLLASASQVIAAYFPTVDITPDPSANLLLISATPEDHKKIREVAKSLDAEDPLTQPTLRVHRTGNVDLYRLLPALRTLYYNNPRIVLNPDVNNRMLTAVATAQEHEFIAGLIAQIENGALSDPNMQVQVYSLWNQNYYTIWRLLYETFMEKGLQIDMNFDYMSRNLIVYARPEEQAFVKSILDAVKVPDRYLEVFLLRVREPESVGMAVYQLFSDEPFRPTVSGDYDTNTIYVRGSRDQIDRIRTLLIQLGEQHLIHTPRNLIKLGPRGMEEGTSGGSEAASGNGFSSMDPAQIGTWNATQGLGSGEPQDPESPLLPEPSGGVLSGQSGILRDIRIDGNFETLAEELRKELLKKGILLEVVEQSQPIIQKKEGTEELKEEKSEIPNDSATEKEGPANPEARSGDGDILFSERDFVVLTGSVKKNRIQFQTPVENPGEILRSNSEPKDGKISDSEPGESSIGNPPVNSGFGDFSSPTFSQEIKVHLIVNQDGSLTIASHDPAALDEVENTIQGLTSRVVLTGRDFTVYAVRNISANVVMQRLRLLLRDRLAPPGATGRPQGMSELSGYSQRQRTLMLELDSTRTAIVVRGSKMEREMVGKYIEQLDRSHLAGETKPLKPINVYIEYGQASRILQQVNAVYQRQFLTTQLPGGGYPRVLLNQTNNSLDIYAPEPLASEIKEYVMEQDKLSATQKTEKIHVVRPEKTNSRTIQSVIYAIQRSSMQQYRLQNPYYVNPYQVYPTGY